MSRSFRSPETQARRMTAKHARHGTPRRKTRGTKLISSIGTERTRRQSLTILTTYLRVTKDIDLIDATIDDVNEWLFKRSFEVRQGTLNKDRLAASILFDEALDRFESNIEDPGLAEMPRAYSQEQVQALKARMKRPNQLATEISEAVGLRAAEILTLRPLSMRAPSPRAWDTRRFEILEGEHFTVHGKGGLIREVVVPHHLATQIHELRLPESRVITDREIRIEQIFDLAGGQRWSNSFSRASKIALGWSAGAHGLRHRFAQETLRAFLAAGYSPDDARAFVSQLLGHFRSDITEVYLR